MERPPSYRQQTGYGSHAFAERLGVTEGDPAKRLLVLHWELGEDSKRFHNIETTVINEALRAHTILMRLEENIQLRNQIGEDEYGEKLTDAEVNLLIMKRVWSSIGPQADLDRYLRESWELELRTRAMLDERLNQDPTKS